MAAALTFVQPGRAQSFFSFYEMSPRQIVGMLEDDGYQLRGPMLRRGDVYVCNVVSVSGRPARLIVDARDGHVLESYAVRAPRWRDPDAPDAPQALRPPRDVGDDRDGASDDEGASHRQEALGELSTAPSRVYGGDMFSQPKPEPEDTPAAKPKHHAAKKHRDPSLAKTSPTPDAATTDKTDGTAAPSVAAVAPTASPEPKKPALDAVKPEAAPTVAAPPEPSQKKAEAAKLPLAESKPAVVPKADQPRKKINDLPVGTLD